MHEGPVAGGHRQRQASGQGEGAGGLVQIVALEEQLQQQPQIRQHPLEFLADSQRLSEVAGAGNPQRQAVRHAALEIR